MEHEEVMADLQRLQNKNTEASEKVDKLAKETGFYRLNFELEMLKIEHKQVMSDLQKLPMEISEAMDKCKHLMEETESIRLLWKEQIELQESCEKVKRFLKEFHEMICGPSAEQQQEQESQYERLKDALKLKEVVTLLGKDLAEKLQHPICVTQI
ncbi:hypothetical protein A6R68_11878, partial [Neotoma lepida]